MADDFLKKYDTKGMTVHQIKELLGEPDFGPDVWRYNLNLEESRSSVPQDKELDLPNQYLWVYFQGSKVQELRITNREDVKGSVEFDSGVWQAGKPQDRVRMVTSLINSGVLKNGSKEDVRRILGEPDTETEKKEVEYSLGVRIIDYETLTFNLDSDGRVTDAKIIEH